MAGTLTISTLSDGTNSTSATNCIQGSAKAWVNFNGVTTATIRASYNVSSVTRNGTGDYTVTFTNALADANYAITGVASNNNSANFGGIQLYNTPTTSSFRFRDVTTNTGTPQDNTYEMLAIFR